MVVDLMAVEMNVVRPPLPHEIISIRDPLQATSKTTMDLPRITTVVEVITIAMRIVEATTIAICIVEVTTVAMHIVMPLGIPPGMRLALMMVVLAGHLAGTVAADRLYGEFRGCILGISPRTCAARKWRMSLDVWGRCCQFKFTQMYLVVRMVL